MPFVLSIGIGFSKAVDAPEGFGMLTIMSVAPIISVLCTSLLRKPARIIKEASIRGTKSALGTISRMSRAASLKRMTTGLTSISRQSSNSRSFASEGGAA